MGICPENGVQTNLLDYDPVRYEKLKRLDEVIDGIKRENGSETIVLGSQQYTAKDGKGKAGVFYRIIAALGMRVEVVKPVY